MKIGSKTIKEWIAYSREAWPLLCFMCMYLLVFGLLEHRVGVRYMEIHVAMDDWIPFVEAFVIPYDLWFPFTAYVMMYLYIKDRENYHRTATVLCAGMTLFLVISYLFPNIQFLRPAVMPRENLFTDMVSLLYRTDTSTNIFPSIHVYNTLALLAGIFRSEGALAKRRIFRVGTAVLGTLIILSTVFLKQHSLVDVLGAFVIFVPFYVLAYQFDIVFRMQDAPVLMGTRS